MPVFFWRQYRRHGHKCSGVALVKIQALNRIRLLFRYSNSHELTWPRDGERGKLRA